MECSCVVDTCVDHEDAINVSLKHMTAVELVKCGECGRFIEPGEEYIFESGYRNYEDPADEPYRFSTCLDCKSIRDNFFEDWAYGWVVDDLEEYIEQAETVEERCIARLTPRARDKVCEMIEDVWKKQEAWGEG